MAGLTVGHADDPAERRADVVAETALARLQRLSAQAALDEPDGRHADDSAGSADPLRRLTTGTDDDLGGEPVPPRTLAVLRRRRGSGAPLPPTLVGEVGAHLGVDLSPVRGHVDAEAAALSSSVQATAFTSGTDVYFGERAYDPSSRDGRRTIAHELVHVAQAMRTAPPAGQAIVGRADDPAEVEADTVADQVVRRLGTTGPMAGDGHAVPVAEPLAAQRPGTARRHVAEGSEPTVLRRKKRGGAAARRRRRQREEQEAERREEQEAERRQAEEAALATRRARRARQRARRRERRALAKQQAQVQEQVQDVGAPADDTSADPQWLDLEDYGTGDLGLDADPGHTDDYLGAGEYGQVHGRESGAPEVWIDPEDARLATSIKSDAGREFHKYMYDEEGSAPLPENDTVASMYAGSMVEWVRSLSPEEKGAILAEVGLLERALRHVGNHKATLLAALEVHHKRQENPERSHLTGAEADELLAERFPGLPVLNPYFQAAREAGSKGAGYVAVVSSDQWRAAYEAEFGRVGTDERAQALETATNAFIAKSSRDTPAVIHADRGHPSTAIHESMHRYSKPELGLRFRGGLNEGVTEYLTRLVTNNDGGPPGTGTERDSYQDDVTFVRDLLHVLGDSLDEQQRTIAEIYFKGDVGLLENRFRGAWNSGRERPVTEELTARWNAFAEAVRMSDWKEAAAQLPPG